MVLAGVNKMSTIITMPKFCRMIKSVAISSAEKPVLG